ncbi:uncharacterized protein LOC112904455 [Agrilus planipennis]|uniref:Uncharacterized protein LOC112904455 n=1 Tax=Agrilus planipennis TaxID=224129 RepID=A0A7F5R3R9_AGRPL|nr:uncharacterized protein LOC112904455 [Agrilus planipennis]
MKILLLRIFLLYVLFCLSEIESVDIIGGKSDDGPPGVCYLKKIKLEIPDKGYVYKGCNLYTCQYPDYVKYGRRIPDLLYGLLHFGLYLVPILFRSPWISFFTSTFHVMKTEKDLTVSILSDMSIFL